MGNVLKPHRQADVLALVRAKYSFREIQERLGIRRETISKYASLAGLWPPDSKLATPEGVATGFLTPLPAQPAVVVKEVSIPKKARSHCEPHHNWIVGEVKKGRNAMAIYQDLVDRFGFTHRYNSVKRYVRGLKKTEPEQYDRLEFLPRIPGGLRPRGPHPSSQNGKEEKAASLCHDSQILPSLLPKNGLDLQ